LWIVPILTGFGPHPRGPKSGQGQLADLDTLVLRSLKHKPSQEIDMPPGNRRDAFDNFCFFCSS
jgi:hypothetical protein